MSNRLIPDNWKQNLSELREEVANTVDRWFRRRGGAPAKSESGEETDLLDFGGFPGGGLPRLDVEETGDAVFVTAELPGLKKKDINVDLDGRTLRIFGEKSDERESRKGHYHFTERSYGAFSRIVPLPCETDRENIEAKYRGGVLKLTLPKTEEAKKRRIEVTVEDE